MTILRSQKRKEGNWHPCQKRRNHCREHSVIFAGQDEIRMKHSAPERFCGRRRGAGKFIAKEPNLYNMKDLVSSL